MPKHCAQYRHHGYATPYETLRLTDESTALLQQGIDDLIDQ